MGGVGGGRVYSCNRTAKVPTHMVAMQSRDPKHRITKPLPSVVAVDQAAYRMLEYPYCMFRGDDQDGEANPGN